MEKRLELVTWWHTLESRETAATTCVGLVLNSVGASASTCVISVENCNAMENGEWRISGIFLFFFFVSFFLRYFIKSTRHTCWIKHVHGEPDRSDLDCKIFLIKFCRDSFINIKK